MHGLDFSRLHFAGSRSGRYYGTSTVVGTWINGRIQIEQQLTPEREPAVSNFEVPCSAPEGGWSRGLLPTLDALRTHVEGDPTKFGTLWVATAIGPPEGETPSTEDAVQVAVVPVVGENPESVRSELSAVFPGNLCLVRARHSLAELGAARRALEELMADKANRIAQIGSGAGDRRIELRLMILTDDRYFRLERVGFDLIELRPMITPVKDLPDR